MRRIKNSVKAIIISAVALVVAVGVVLGIVFGTRGGDGSNGGNQGNSTHISQLVNDISLSEKKSEIRTYDSSAYSAYADYQNIKKLTKSYFVYKNQSGDDVVYFYHYSNNSYSYVNLTSKANDVNPGFVHKDALKYKIINSNDNYVVIESFLAYGYGENQAYASKAYYSVVYVGGEYPKEVYSYDTSSLNFSVYVESKLTDTMFTLSLATESAENETASKLQILVTRLATKTDDVVTHAISDYIWSESTPYRLHLGNNNFLFCTNDGVEAFYLKDGEFKSSSIKLQAQTYAYNFEYDIVKLNNSAFLIEEKNEVDALYSNAKSVIDDNRIYNYSYLLISFDDDSIKQTRIATDNSYAKIEALPISDYSDYFYVCEQKVVDNKLVDEFLSKYYRNSGKLILEYTSAKMEFVRFANGKRFLTDNKIFELKNGKVETNFLFSDYPSFSITQKDITEPYFTYCCNGHYGIMSINGEFVIDVVNDQVEPEILFNKIYDVNEGFAIGYIFNGDGTKDYYAINTKTKEHPTYLASYYEDDNISSILESGVNITILSNTNQGTVEFYIDEPLLCPNVTSYRFFESISTGAVLEIYNNQTLLKIVVVDSETPFDFNNDEAIAYNILNHNRRFVEKYADVSVKIKIGNAGDEKLNPVQNGTEIGILEAWHTFDYWAVAGNGYIDSFLITMNYGYYIKHIKFVADFVNPYNYTVSSGSMTSATAVSATVSSNNSHTGTATVDSSSGKVKYDWPGKAAFYPYAGLELTEGDESLTYNASDHGYRGFPFSVTYNGNGGTASTTSSATEYSRPFQIPTTVNATRTGYTFKGWASSSDGSTAVTGFEKIEGNNTVYAIWEPNKYTVSLDLKGGSGSPATIYYTYGDNWYSDEARSNVIEKITVPTRSGYDFIGFDESDGTDRIDADGKILPKPNYAAVNKTWYAQWKVKNYKVNFVFGTYDKANKKLYDAFINSGGSYVKVASNANPINTPGTQFIITVNTYSGTSSNFVLGDQIFSWDSDNYSGSGTVSVSSGDIGFAYTSATTVNSLNSCTNWQGYMTFTARTITTNGLTYSFENWLIKTAENKETYKPYSEISTATHSFWEVTKTGRITLYACYKQKPLYLGAKYDVSYFGSNQERDNFALTSGWGSGDNASSKLNAQNVVYSVQAKDTLRNTAATNVANNSHNTDIGLYGNAELHLAVNIDHYSLYKIEISNVGYCVNNTTFGIATITMLYDGANWNISTSAGDLVVDGQSFYLGNVYDGVRYNMFSYTVENGTEDHLKHSDGVYTRLVLTITKHWFPTYKDGSTFKLDAANLHSTNAMYGIVVTPYARAKENKNDTVSVEAASTGYGSTLVLNAQKLDSTQKAFYAYYGSKYYKFVLKSHTTKGYYLIPSNLSESSVLEPTTTVTFANATAEQIKRLIFVENSYAYYFSSSVSNCLSTGSYVPAEIVSVATNKYFAMNSKNVQIMAIEPEQIYVQGSVNPSSLTSKNDAADKYTKYELKSYLSNLQIATTNISLSLDRTVTENTAYVYNDPVLMSATSSEATISDVAVVSGNSYITFSYLGVTYTIYDGISFTVDSRNFVLYLSRNTSTNKTLYFLMSYGSQTELSSTVKLTFSRFDYTIDISTSLKESDDLYVSGSTTGASVSLQETNGFVTSLTGNSLTVQPADTSIFKISPISGYIIDSVKVEFSVGKYATADDDDKKVVYQISLNDNSFDNLNFTGNTFTYLTSGNNYQLNYHVSKHVPLDYNLGGATKIDDVYGIYATDLSSNAWNGEEIAAFETLYLLVGGVYGDVKVTVTTKSYVEISFFDTNNSLKDNNTYSTINSNHGTIENIDNLHIMVFDPATAQNKWVEVTSSICDYVIKNSIAGGATRIVFVGKAKYFQRGVKIFATGSAYSSFFRNGLLYMEASTNETHCLYEAGKGINYSFDVNNKNVYEGRTNEGNQLNTTVLNYADKLTYIEINSKNFTQMFENSKINTGYEFAKKYILNFTSAKNEVQINTNSYLFNSVQTGDGYNTFNSVESSFNSSNTKNVTNTGTISLKAEKSALKSSVRNKNWIVEGSSYYCYQLDYVVGSTTKSNSWFNDTILTNIEINTNAYTTALNWQTLDKDASKTNATTDNDGAKMSGYDLSYKYYCIPGYFLQYITLSTIDNGLVYIHIPSILMNGTTELTTYNAALFGTKKIYYRVQYKTDANGPYYDIQFYKSLTETDLNDNINSIALMSNDVVVNFYSMAYSYDIEYHDNINSTKVSSYTTLKWNGVTANVGTIQKQNGLYYDSFVTINKYLTLNGYTFIGWGSQNYVTFDAYGNVAYDDNGNVVKETRYDYSYKWNSSSAWFDISEYFAYNKRAYLSSLLSISPQINTSYDFYIKSSNTLYTNDTGYFLTDTGYKSNENYNFWSAYIDKFAPSVGRFNSESAEATRALKTISLYGVWKPNTYSLTFNVNDKNKDNGSTLITANKKNSTYSWAFNDDMLSVDNSIGLSLSGGSNKTYYFYITFDTNNWFVVDADMSSTMSVKTGSTSYLYNSSGENLLDFVIDRYGYSWLGWSYTKLDNYLEVLTTSTPTDENKLVFASNYYYSNYSASVRSSTLPTLNFTLYNQITQKNEAFDSVSSEFVYKGASETYLNKICAGGYTQASSYVYFYDYKRVNKNLSEVAGTIGVANKSSYFAEDYLNKDNEPYTYNATDKAYFAYFDTSLSYQAYSIISGSLSVTRNFERFKYKYISVYAYWQTNLYTFEIDFRDDPTNVNSFEPVGSDTVKDKDSYTFYNNNTAYFDDETLITRLLNFNPVRVGYDFLGWTFFYEKGAVNGVYTSEYCLNSQLLSRFNVTIGQENVTMIPLFTSDTLCQSNRQAMITSSTVQESYGDAEAHNHYVYIFAIWEAQTLTANLSLNIEAEDLENLYENDSSFAVAFYKQVGIPYDSYSAVKFDFTKRTNTTYTEIVANINFVFTFDDYFANGYCMIGSQKFMLKDLFAVSTGYYLVGWLIDSADPKSMIIANTLKSTFMTQTETQVSSNGYGSLTNLNSTGKSTFGLYQNYPYTTAESTFVEDVNGTSIVFDINFYHLLYSSKYKHEIASGEEFLHNNKVYLSDYDSAGESSNFGYLAEYNDSDLLIDKHYFAVEKISAASGKTHYIYFKYQGVKYYVLLYVLSGSNANVLDNDGEFLYYTIGSSKYVVDFDFDGTPYYTRSTYAERQELDIRIAVFKEKTDVISDYNLMDYSESMGNITYYFDYGAENQAEMKLNLVSTREFTLYAHWEIKQDKIDIMNGNNTTWVYENSNVYDQNGNQATASQTSISNVGLAGYYEIDHYNNGTGIGVVESGPDSYYKDGISRTYDFYEDIDFTMIPYFNGRYLSDVNIRFYVIENYNSLTTTDNFLTWFKTTYYDIRIKFAWDSANNNMYVSQIVLYKDGSTSGTNCLFTKETDGNGVVSISKLRADNKQISQLSLLDSNSFEDVFIKIYPYSTYNDRLDIQKVELNLMDVMTNVEVTARFSVQTYNIKLYNILDDNGNNIKIMNESVDMYETPYTITEFNNMKNAGEISYPGYVSSLKSDKTNLATISTDAATNISSYDVPYGYFIYGNYYQSAVTPMNETATREGTEEVYLKNLDQRYGGYEYLYSYGFYNYGTTATSIEGTLADSYTAQGSPILGGNVFAQSVRLSLSFYTFAGWFEYQEDGGAVYLRNYTAVRESQYIKRNITLYAYYYSRNNPTSLQFYTWDDASRSYKLYTGNSDAYTLNADIVDSPFVTNSSNLLEEKEEKVFYTDDNGYAMINIGTKYGVDQVLFKEQQITLSELSNDPNRTDDVDVMKKLLRSYWYYTMSYDVLYYNDNGTKRYICYDHEKKNFYYKNAAGTKVVVDVYTKDYEYYQMVKGGVYTDLISEDKIYYDFDGAKLYVKILGAGSGDIDKYFEIKPLTDAEILSYYGAGTSTGKTFVENYDFRYYVDMFGERYYFMPRNKGATYSSSRTLYTDDNNIYHGTYSIETLDMNYIIYNGHYYPVEYVSSDYNGGGSSYVNPYKLENKVKFKVDGVEKTYYLNYEDRYLYDTSGYVNKVSSITYKTYCPVNYNYTINSKYNEAERYWEIIGITINQLPSPNLDYWYNNAEYGFVGYIRFDSDEFDVLINPDGPINTQFIKYVDSRYANKSAVYRANLKSAIASRIASDYTIDKFLSSFMSAASYKLSSDGSYVEVVVVNIPCSFEDITFVDENGESQTISLSIIAQHEFMVINKSMIIDTDIMAIPIYSPYVMKFNSNSQTLDTSTKLVTIKPKQMNVWHFDTSGSSTHIYNTANGDYLNFVILKKDQYNYFYDQLNTTISTTISSILQSMIYKNSYKEIYVESVDSATVPVSINMASYEAGEYFIFSYYYKSGLQDSVVRVSDNFIHITITSGGGISSEVTTMTAYEAE